MINVLGAMISVWRFLRFTLQEALLAPRKAPPCDVEIMALVQLSAVPLLVRLQDGNKVEVEADSWTSVTDLEKQARHAWRRKAAASIEAIVCVTLTVVIAHPGRRTTDVYSYIRSAGRVR